MKDLHQEKSETVNIMPLRRILLAYSGDIMAANEIVKVDKFILYKNIVVAAVIISFPEKNIFHRCNIISLIA